jgi:hypothetical protein
MPPAKSKLTVTVLPRRSTLKPASSALTVAPYRSRYERGAYPWDDHQDSIIVRSVELNYISREDGRAPLIGVDHYLHELTKEVAYDHVCTHFDEYRKTGADSEPDSKGGEEVGIGDVLGRGDKDVDYSIAPYPAEEYDHPVYITLTTNPAVFLAIIRIAQHNLPAIDFRGAMIHLPNLAPDTGLPKLRKGKPAATHPHRKHATDTMLKVAFLPHFYEDRRHAIGYYSIAPPFDHWDDPNPPSRVQTSRMWIQTCIFTPCTVADLEFYGLVEWTSRRGGKEWRNIQNVGCRGGDWVRHDLVEEWEEWDEGVCAAGEVWEGRMGRGRVKHGF